MKVLVIGGMHGNEKLGISLVESLQKNPIPGVDALIANPRAVDVSHRFVDTDLNRSFGDGASQGYESQRASELTAVVADYDVVLDFHNTMTPNNNCSFIGPDLKPELLGVSASLGLSRCIRATYDCINRWCSNVVSIEISVDDELDAVPVWRERIRQLVAGRRVSTEVKVYVFVGRCTWEQKEMLRSDDWRPFEQIDVREQTALGYGEPLYPIFVGSKFTEYYATLLREYTEEL